MRFMFTFGAFTLASIKLAQAATCATCAQGCLLIDTGDCQPNWPESTCEIYRGV